MLNWMGRTALELVGQAGLGYSFDSMTEDAAPHKYVADMKGLLFVSSCFSSFSHLLTEALTTRPLMFKLIFHLTYILPWTVNIGTPRFRRLVIDFLSVFWRDVRDLRDKSDFMWKVSEEIYNEKKRALEEGDEAVSSQVGKGKDILSVLSESKLSPLFFFAPC